MACDRPEPAPRLSEATLDGRLLEEVPQLVERQADAAIPAGDRDFTGYIADVLFDDWDQVRADAARAGTAAGPLCASAASAVGSAGLRCLVSYRALARLAEDAREGQPSQAEIQAISAILDKLQAAGN